MNLNINNGEIVLTINNDPDRVMRFNPNSTEFADRYYALLVDFQAKETEYRRKIEKLAENTTVDNYGIPANMKEQLALTHEICNHLKEQIDNVFGAGTSKTVFGDETVLEAFEQFFEGVAPYIQNARAGKIKKYSTAKTPGVLK